MSIDNAGNPSQRAKMEKLRAEGLCLFCGENYLLVDGSPKLYESTHWYVKESDYPYPGSAKHLLIASRTHVCSLDELSEEAWSNFRKILRVVRNSISRPGLSLLVREGDSTYTGSTYQHIHFHVIYGYPKPSDWKSVEENNVLATVGFKK